MNSSKKKNKTPSKKSTAQNKSAIAEKSAGSEKIETTPKSAASKTHAISEKIETTPKAAASKTDAVSEKIETTPKATPQKKAARAETAPSTEKAAAPKESDRPKEAAQEDEFAFPPAATATPRSPKLWLQILLFVFILGFAIYPYLVRNVPWLERWFAPGASAEREGDQALQEGRCDRAIQAYRKAHQAIQANNTPKQHARRRAMLRYKTAFCLLRQEQHTQAIQEAEAAIQADPPWPLPYELVLRLYLRHQKSDQIASIEQNMQKYFASQWKMWLLLGDVYTHQRLYPRALQAYEQALRIAPKDPELLDHTARALLLQPKVSPQDALRAEQYATRALQLQPAAPPTDTHLPSLRPYMLETLALAKEERGDLQAALQHAQQAHRSAQDRIARTRFKRLLDRLQHRLAPPPPPQPARPHTPPTTQTTHSNTHTLPSRPTTQPTTFRRLPPPPLPQQDPHTRSRHILSPFE